MHIETNNIYRLEQFSPIPPIPPIPPISPIPPILKYYPNHHELIKLN